ncbi:hypothetical protein EPA93_08450 [Ktedonosporobacter rubrisoli]|uniref:XRE family transcriptional regulator n=1 Tax=Ktedonosporobacter rubrisoli TaxID=2509675 RepID=A0A4P6JLG4_KTERU|nr:hypothetical protein [Ktedonosporobacter rubrisoli]QBD76034.1 hypothetical protein EPA93_08450 [Ktedonosporobacter rubrisoli]
MKKLSFYCVFQWMPGISLLALARESNRHPYVIWDLLLGHAMQRDDAAIILATFNELSGTDYTLDQFAIIFVAKAR